MSQKLSSPQTVHIELYDKIKPLELGFTFGFVIQGHTLPDYLRDASTKESGYETLVIWGTQGNGKSSRMLQMLFQVYLNILKDVTKAWETVLSRLVFRPNDFIELIDGVPDDKTLGAVGWDDIGVHYPSTKFKTDIKAYEAIDSTWAAIRTKAHVVIVTIPVIDRLAKNIKDNVTFELFIGKNQVQLCNRWFRLPGFKENSNFFKAKIGKPKKFFLVGTEICAPPWVWAEYWRMRIELTKEAISKLRSVTKGDIKGHIPVLEAGEIAFSQGIRFGTASIQQSISRGVLRGERYGNILFVNENDFYRELRLKGGVDYRTIEKPTK